MLIPKLKTDFNLHKYAMIYARRNASETCKERLDKFYLATGMPRLSINVKWQAIYSKIPQRGGLILGNCFQKYLLGRRYSRNKL